MSSANRPKVDLVIVIDTSRSMKDEAVSLSKAAEAVLQTAELRCPADLRTVWLGVEGVWKGTRFDRTVRDYLTTECKAQESDLLGRKRGEVPGGGAQEDGARAMEDIAVHFGWRRGTHRAIFYLSDESLEGGGETVEGEAIEAANRAIATAKRRRVNVHTYLGTPTRRTKPESREHMKEEYARVARETGGAAFTSDASEIGFDAVLQDIVCVTQDKPPAPRETVPGQETESTTKSPSQERRGPRKKRGNKRLRIKEVKHRGSRVVLVKLKRKKKKKRSRRCDCGQLRIGFWLPEPRGPRTVKFRRYDWKLGKSSWWF